MTESLKVLYIVNIPSPYRVAFFNELGKHCKLTVLFERDSSSEREESWLAKEFQTFVGIFLSSFKIQSDTVIGYSVLKYLNRLDYDVIVIGGYSTPTGMLSIEYMKFRKIPFILNTDGGIINYNESTKRKRLKSRFISAASEWLSTGNKTSEYLEYYGASRDRIRIYPFTTLYKEDILDRPISVGEKKSIRKRLGITEQFVVLSVGQFIHRKGFDVLIEATKSIDRNCGFYFVGGEPTAEYTEMVNKYKLDNVHFVGFKNKTELAEYYKMSDVFVLPTREDIWGLVINEAMAYGLPVVTTDACVAGLELIENGENGCIVPVDDKEQLSNSITQLLADDSLRLQMSEKNIEKSKRYTLENMASVTLNILENFKNTHSK